MREKFGQDYLTISRHISSHLWHMSQDLVVHYQYHYSTDYACYLVLRAYLGHSISILTKIDKVSLLSPGNNKHFGIRY